MTRKRSFKIELVLFALAWLVAIASVCRSAEPSKLIDAPAQVAPYRMVDVRLAGEWESALFSIEPESAVDSRTSADGKLFTFVAPPATYTIRVVAVNFSTKRLAQGKASVVIGDAMPPAPPTPPTPPVPPGPSPTKPVALYVIYESGDLTPAMARVRDAIPWKATADSLGVKWLCFDRDSGAKKFPQATQRAIAAGLPAVVFLDAKGVPDVAKLPATAEAMDSLVKAKAK